MAVGANGAAPAVDAANTGDGSLNLRLSSSAAWLAPALGTPRGCPLRGDGCIPVQLELRTASLARGTYTGVVTVSDPAALDAPQTITVTVQVGGAVPERVDLYAAVNGQPAEYRFATSSSLQSSVRTESGGDWLAVASEGSGSFRFGMTTPYRITGSPAGLPEGAYNGQVSFSGSHIPTENRAVPVTLRVTSQPIAQTTPERLAFRIAQGSAAQLQYLSLTNRGQGTLSLTGATSATASGGDWLSAEKLPNASLIAVRANPANLAPGIYQGTVSIASNAAQGALTVPVELDIIAAGPPVAYYQGVVNNATFEAGDFLAQGAIVAVFGEQFTTGEPRSAASLPLGTELGGARVFVNGQPAPVYYVSYNQINFQIPYEAAAGGAVIRVERDGQRGNEISARIVPGAPRLLRLGIGDYGIVVNQDGSFPIPATPGLNSRPARAGETLVLYAIGVGPTDPPAGSGAAAPSSPLARARGAYRVLFGASGPFGGGDVEATPAYVGLTPGFVGLYQINVAIPEGAPRGDAVPLLLVGENGSSNRVMIAIE